MPQMTSKLKLAKSPRKCQATFTAKIVSRSSPLKCHHASLGSLYIESHMINLNGLELICWTCIKATAMIYDGDALNQ